MPRPSGVGARIVGTARAGAHGNLIDDAESILGHRSIVLINSLG
jgi:hypothetical protein